MDTSQVTAGQTFSLLLRLIYSGQIFNPQEHEYYLNVAVTPQTSINITTPQQLIHSGLQSGTEQVSVGSKSIFILPTPPSTGGITYTP